MSSVGEVPVVGKLNVAQRRLRELRLEIDRSNPRCGAMKDECGGPRPKRSRGRFPRFQISSGIPKQRLQLVHRIPPTRM